MEKKTPEKWFPVIDYNTCIQCLTCYDFCTNGVYTLQDSKPVVSNPDKCCYGCKCCQPKCPTTPSSITYFGDDGTIPAGPCECSCDCQDEDCTS